jgi:hypothetical protein
MRFPNKIGLLLLGIWLIATGLFVLIPTLNFAGSDNVLAVLAIIAGILVLIDR